MSLLMFFHDEDEVMIFTDTLATSPDDEPMMFQTKAWPLPHLNMALAVTGIANLGEAWYDALRSSVVARDVGGLNAFAQAELQRIWAQMQTEHDGLEGQTVTIYHFGFVGESNNPVRYTYRSRRGFEPELTEEPGFGIKPEPQSFPLSVPESLEDIVALAENVRNEQDALIDAKPIRIGGELHVLRIRNHESNSRVVYRWADYEEMYQQMLARLHRTQGVA